MTYRDDTAMLTERLAALEDDRARRSGTVGGLAVALAEAAERVVDAERALDSLPRREKVKHAAARGAGCSSALALLAAAVFAVHQCATCSSPIEDSVELTVVESDMADVEAGARCTVSVEGDSSDDPDPCAAALYCNGVSVYSGRGDCRAFYGDAYLEFWDHGSSEESPRFVVAESEHAAILRHASSIVVFRTE